MRRRDLIAMFGGAAALLPLAARAQQSERAHRIGALIAFPENHPTARAFVDAFVQGLQSLGWVEGKNIRTEYRFAAGDPVLFRRHAAELVGLAPDAIVQSLARPGGNVTGFASYDASIVGKWLELLKEAAPDVTRAAVIFNPDTALAPPLNRVIAAASSLGITVTLAPVHDDPEIEQALGEEARKPGGGLVVLPDSFNVTHHSVITAAATVHRLPTISWGEFTRLGGLLSYWFDASELHAAAASYVDRILRGADPADLPVQYPTKFELVINLKTAKALGLTVPQSLLARADEVIE